MRSIYAEHGLFVDPHTAVGCAAAGDHLAGDREEQVIVLSTAHPGKFTDIVRQATGATPPLPERLARCLSLPKQSHPIGKTLPQLSEFLLDSFG
jgi:threonine synthase